MNCYLATVSPQSKVSDSRTLTQEVSTGTDFLCLIRKLTLSEGSIYVGKNVIKLFPEVCCFCFSPPGIAEVRSAIENMKNGKAPGIDSLQAELLKADILIFVSVATLFSSVLFF